MRLTGSNAEDEYRKQLLSSNKSLFEDEEKRRILSALVTCYPNMRTAYPIEWIPDQDVDIYFILIDVTNISRVEIDRYNLDSEVMISDISLEEYKRSTSKSGRMKLAVALDLARIDD